jgi:AcrR family transcriptional regulator
VTTRFERRKRESRSRILDAAFELFRAQGMDRTTIEEICERADVANRTFFNHFPKRDDMVRALSLERLRGVEDVLATRRESGPAVPAPELVVEFFDEIARFLESSGPFYRELVGAMLNLSPGATDRSSELFGAFLTLVKEGVARGEVTTRHDPITLTDVVVGVLVSALRNWTADDSYSIRAGLHDVGAALADLLARDEGER